MGEFINVALGAMRGGVTNVVVLIPAIVLGIVVTQPKLAVGASVALNGLLFGFAFLFLVGDKIADQFDLDASGKIAVWAGGMLAAGWVTGSVWFVKELISRRKREAS